MGEERCDVLWAPRARVLVGRARGHVDSPHDLAVRAADPELCANYLEVNRGDEVSEGAGRGRASAPALGEGLEVVVVVVAAAAAGRTNRWLDE